jgi:hypothetical protein
MKIGLAFWGLTRSLKYTIKSINEKILNILNGNNIEYKIFMHTWFVSTLYNNKRANETNIILDNEEYKLLNPDHIEIHNQDEFKDNINFKAFRTHNDPWKTNYQTVDNFICAMFSKSRCAQLIKKSNENFDYIIFLRPDVMYLNDFNLIFLKLVNNDNICIPNFALYSNFNDRFCICNMNNYLLYGDVFSKLLNYSKHYPLHSETFYYKLITNQKININYIPFYFNRVRANGEVGEGGEVGEVEKSLT